MLRLNYASPNLRFAYTGMQACIDDTFGPINYIINGLKIVYIDDTISTVNDYINFRI